MCKSVGLKQCEVWRVSSFQLFAFKLSATWSNYFFISPFVFKKEVMARKLTRPWTLQRKLWMLQYHFLNQMSQHYVTSLIVTYGEIQYILNHKLKNSKSKASSILNFKFKIYLSKPPPSPKIRMSEFLLHCLHEVKIIGHTTCLIHADLWPRRLCHAKFYITLPS